MPKTRTAEVTPKEPQNLDFDVFTNRLAEKMSELLSAFVLGIENGELSLDLENAEEWLHAELDEWCETESPNRALHLRAIVAIMVWMIIDELYAEDIDGDDGQKIAPTPAEMAAKVQRVAKLSVEAIRTVQSIWGILHGKAQ
jgi:hypothetical protein